MVFIFSKGEAFPMLNQSLCEHPALPIFWDYHVVLLVINKNNQIFDFDTTLAFNTDIDFYFKESFINQSILSDKETPMFRLVPADEFTSSFSSDRSHMKTLSGWLSPPPNWPIIGNKGTNLESFIQANDNQFGELLTYDALLSRFTEQ